MAAVSVAPGSCGARSLSLRSKRHRHPLRKTSLRPRLPAISAVHFEELVEKDWSFLYPSSDEGDRASKTDRIIAAGGVGEESKVLACFPTAAFVDRLVETRPCELVIATHESLFLLAEIKENHDAVRCWQGGVEAVPERFSPLNAAFVCYFPAMGVPIGQLLESLSRRCSPGSRVVIGCEQGREAADSQRRQYPDMVTSDLPDRSSLDQAAAENFFRVVEFVDESTFYLAVLELSASTTAS
ncbi:unnamed protein product [Spirodela intermedia]|nr:unnamed protein product [Spirodela intermedia]CAA6662266.1 unnamed protein product [Spirodela intermedia]